MPITMGRNVGRRFPKPSCTGISKKVMTGYKKKSGAEPLPAANSENEFIENE